MELRISINSDQDDGTLLGLYRWLARDADLAHQSRMSLISAPPAPGEQSGVFEAVNIVLANVTALGGLITAVLSYRDTRRRGRTVPGSVRLETNGMVVTIEPGSKVSAEYIITRLIDPPGPKEETHGPEEKPDRP